MGKKIELQKTVATRFIEAFNTNDWDTLREVVAPNYVFHHPVGETVQAGPEGMVAVWSDFKKSLPDSWHPIPIMITEGDYLAVLLPTYGHFTGAPYHGAKPTGNWLEYGMVNIVRFDENNKIVENWLGMDPLAERQQMGAAPSMPPRERSSTEKENIKLFQQKIKTPEQEFDNLTAFEDVVIAIGPPQYEKDTTNRKVEIYNAVNGMLELVYTHEFKTNPPYAGDPSIDTQLTRTVSTRFIEEVLIKHDLNALVEIVSPNILIHPTAMPCEASYYGINGLSKWLIGQWNAFPDLTITNYFTIAQGDVMASHWTANGTSKGNFLMLSPTGNSVTYSGSTMYRIENGKIVEIWETRNTLSIMRQLNPNIGKSHNHH